MVSTIRGLLFLAHKSVWNKMEKVILSLLVFFYYINLVIIVLAKSREFCIIKMGKCFVFTMCLLTTKCDKQKTHKVFKSWMQVLHNRKICVPVVTRTSVFNKEQEITKYKSWDTFQYPYSHQITKFQSELNILSFSHFIWIHRKWSKIILTFVISLYITSQQIAKKFIKLSSSCWTEMFGYCTDWPQSNKTSILYKKKTRKIIKL